MSRIPVYFMPGLAASSKIFEYVKLDDSLFETHYLEWLEPLDKKESISEYVTRLAQNIKHENTVLIGVSFGGIIVQELSKLVNAKQVIIISSIQNPQELPTRLQVIRNTKAYKLTPTKLLSSFDTLEKVVFGNWAKKRLELYKKYLVMNSQNYLKWAIHNVLYWQKSADLIKPIHIHGDNDEIFPIKKLNPDYTVAGGTHIMIINKAKWFNKMLPEIIIK